MLHFLGTVFHVMYEGLLITAIIASLERQLIHIVVVVLKLLDVPGAILDQSHFFNL